MQHVDKVLQLLSENKLFLKWFKSDFGAFEVEYVGHIVSQQTVQVGPKKIEAIQDYPQPKTLKIWCGFVRLTGYYQKFVKNYGIKLSPLIDLQKKNSFVWNGSTMYDSSTSKESTCNKLVLAICSFIKTFSWNVIRRVMVWELYLLKFTYSKYDLKSQSFI